MWRVGDELSSRKDSSLKSGGTAAGACVALVRLQRGERVAATVGLIVLIFSCQR